MAPSRYGVALLSLVLAMSQLVLFVSAQGTSTSSTATPTVVPSTALYTYMGCYNETTGYAQAGNVRALSEGNQVRVVDVYSDEIFTLVGLDSSS